MQNILNSYTLSLVNKNVLIGVVLLLVLGVGGYFFLNKKTSVSTPAQTQTSGPTSLKDLLAANLPQKCTFPEGTVYISGGKFRGDFSSDVSGKAVVSHMISDSKTSYIWTDDQKQGFKMTISDEVKAEGQTEVDKNGVDVNAKLDYKCSTWLPDSSLFNTPSGVEFTDFSALIAPADSGSNSVQCAACASLTGDDKTQCLAVLNCTKPE